MYRIPYIFPYTAFYGPVQLIRPYISRCNSKNNFHDTLPLTLPYSYLLDTGDSQLFFNFLQQSTLKCYLEKIYPPLQCRNAQHVYQMFKRGEVLISRVLEIIKMYVQKIKVGRPTYLNSDEEALVVASAEIEGAHGLPIDVNTLRAKLQIFIKSVNSQQSTKYIIPNS